MSHDWSRPEDLVTQVERLWNRGEILRAPLMGIALFPRRLKLKRPSSRELGPRFEEVRRWIRDLQHGSAKYGYVLEFEEVAHRQLGNNQVPNEVTVESEAVALKMIGKQQAAQRFGVRYREIVEQFPSVAAWAQRSPLRVLDLNDDWSLLLRTMRWFCDHPTSGLYRRQLEIEGVDTKFIERHRLILAELLELILSPEQLHAERGDTFDRRFGLREKPSLVRFRLLDSAQTIHGLSDLTVPVTDLARLDLAVDEVIVTENEVNGLALLPRPRTLVVFGHGYAVERLREVGWLKSRRVLYWGDIDTHGFAMLDRFRQHVPNCESLMMNQDTLLTHRAMWVTEHEPSTETPERLTEAERQLLRELNRGTYGDRIRLEQERISFAHVRRALGQLDEPQSRSP